MYLNQGSLNLQDLRVSGVIHGKTGTGPGGRSFSSKKLVPGLPVLGKAILAINRSSLSGLERYFAIFTTV